jgi:hypothetical protein
MLIMSVREVLMGGSFCPDEVLTTTFPSSPADAISLPSALIDTAIAACLSWSGKEVDGDRGDKKFQNEIRPFFEVQARYSPPGSTATSVMLLASLRQMI